MLGDEVRSARVQASSEERAHDQVDQRIPSERLDQQGVEGEYSGEVDEMPRGGFLRSDESRSKSVEQDLERAGRQDQRSDDFSATDGQYSRKEGLSCDIVQDDGFESTR